MILSTLFVSLLASKLTYGYRTSAGGACTTDAIGGPHRNANSAGGFTLNTPTSYGPGETLQFTVTGGTVTGIIVYCEDSNKSKAGTFTLTSSDYRLQTCNGSPASLISHTKNLSNSAWTFTFNAPTEAKGTLVCKAGITNTNVSNYYVATANIAPKATTAPPNTPPANTPPPNTPPVNTPPPNTAPIIPELPDDSTDDQLGDDDGEGADDGTGTVAPTAGSGAGAESIPQGSEMSSSFVLVIVGSVAGLAFIAVGALVLAWRKNRRDSVAV